MRAGNDEKGFTYLGLLIAIALIGIWLLAASEVWVTSARRQRLVELEWIGSQFVQAIGSYYNSAPGSQRSYPQTLEDLLEDKRYLTVKRHLRAIYVNPFTAKTDWTLVRGAGGQVIGVRAVVPVSSGLGHREYLYIPQADVDSKKAPTKMSSHSNGLLDNPSFIGSTARQAAVNHPEEGAD